MVQKPRKKKPRSRVDPEAEKLESDGVPTSLCSARSTGLGPETRDRPQTHGGEAVAQTSLSLSLKWKPEGKASPNAEQQTDASVRVNFFVLAFSLTEPLSDRPIELPSSLPSQKAKVRRNDAGPWLPVYPSLSRLRLQRAPPRVWVFGHFSPVARTSREICDRGRKRDCQRGPLSSVWSMPFSPPLGRRRRPAEQHSTSVVMYTRA